MSFTATYSPSPSVQIDVEKGELTTIVGANASGKSTLINTISGILRQRIRNHHF